MRRTAVGLVLAAAVLLVAPAGAAFRGGNGTLAFIGPGDGVDFYTRLNGVNPDDTHNRTLAVPQVFGFYADPDWSPDGNVLAFVAGSDPVHVGVWAFRFGETRVSQLVRAGDVCCPAWSPDGRAVAFTDNGEVAVVRGGRVLHLGVRGRVGDWSSRGLAVDDGRAVWLVAADGSSRRRIGEGRAPNFAPDGRLAFVRGGALYVASVRGEIERVPLRRPVVGAPEWSPDGSLIAVALKGCALCDELELWVVRPDGTRLRRLRAANVDATHGAVAWQPQRRGTVVPE